MDPRHRDGLLALCGLCGLTGLGVLTGHTATLADPLGIGVGVIAAVAVEVVFLWYPSQAMNIWKRQWVPLASLCVVLVAGVLAVTYVPVLLTAAVWGLLTYLVLLGCVLVGVENPVSVLLRGVE